MKFLIFNAVVAAALIYLFTADREELRATADRVYDGARAVQGSVETLAEKHDRAFANETFPGATAAPERAAVSEPEAPSAAPPAPPSPSPAAQDVVPLTTVEAPRDLAEPTAGNFFETVVAEEKIATLEPAGAPQELAPLSEQSVAALPVHPVPDQPPLSGLPALGDLPPVSDPAVERRRAEVLEGVAGIAGATRPGSAPAVVIPEGVEMMSPDERLRALYDLAEEMELLAVTKIHQ
jgi:hypothetical protein